MPRNGGGRIVGTQLGDLCNVGGNPDRRISADCGTEPARLAYAPDQVKQSASYPHPRRIVAGAPPGRALRGVLDLRRGCAPATPRGTLAVYRQSGGAAGRSSPPLDRPAPDPPASHLPGVAPPGPPLDRSHGRGGLGNGAGMAPGMAQEWRLEWPREWRTMGTVTPANG